MGYGSLQDWCANEGSLELRVERPGTLALDIGCPTSTYGLSFQELPAGQDRDQVFDWPVTLQTSEGWPPDAYVGAHGIGDILVQVVAPTAEEAQAILGTVRAIGPEGDPNGCPVDKGSYPVVLGDSMAVCRYDAARPAEQSELLTGDEVSRAVKALRDAPATEGPGCTADDGSDKQFIRLSSSAADAAIDLKCGCAHRRRGDRTGHPRRPLLGAFAGLGWFRSGRRLTTV